MTASSLVRPAGPADLEALLDIYNDAVRRLDAIWTEIEETLDQRAAWMEGRVEAGFPVLVAEDGGRVMGYGSYGPYRPRSGYRLTVEHSIYLKDEAQGRGLGTALMAALIEDARQKGFHLMVGVIDAENAGSIRFHQRFGFELVGRLPEAGFKRGRWLDQVNMVLKLGDGPPPPAGS